VGNERERGERRRECFLFKNKKFNIVKKMVFLIDGPYLIIYV